ncbi:MAG: gamma-glutamylcyclotransferase [Sneathiellales bacterium]|nr:gamma-glutamylcyclotransferase [Sneathiellales bacterium]
MLKREDFTPERVDELIAEARKHGPYDALTHEEREQNRQSFLKEVNEDGLWVFGYGSLLWNPAFHYSHSEPARLYGYRRSFCLHMAMGRGSAELPGIMLALDHGGSCNGRAFFLPPNLVDSETRILWLREMLSGAYNPCHCTVDIKGERTPAMTFVVNRSHNRYIKNLDEAEKLKRLATGQGYLGSCREYLNNTIAHLDEINVKDRYLHSLQMKLDQAYPEKK